jgi:hypothetical protein
MCLMLRAGLAMAILAVLLASCGGGTTPEPGVSPATFAQKGNDVCRRYHAKFNQVKEVRSTRDFKRWSRQILPVMTAGVKEFEGLTPPASSKADWDHYVALARDQLALVRQLGRQGARNSHNGVDHVLVKVKHNNAQSDPIARKLKLDACI